MFAGRGVLGGAAAGASGGDRPTELGAQVATGTSFQGLQGGSLSRRCWARSYSGAPVTLCVSVYPPPPPHRGQALHAEKQSPHRRPPFRRHPLRSAGGSWHGLPPRVPSPRCGEATPVSSQLLCVKWEPREPWLVAQLWAVCSLSLTVRRLPWPLEPSRGVDETPLLAQSQARPGRRPPPAGTELG